MRVRTTAPQLPAPRPYTRHNQCDPPGLYARHARWRRGSALARASVKYARAPGHETTRCPWSALRIFVHRPSSTSSARDVIAQYSPHTRTAEALPSSRCRGGNNGAWQSAMRPSATRHSAIPGQQRAGLAAAVSVKCPEIRRPPPRGNSCWSAAGDTKARLVLRRLSCIDVDADWFQGDLVPSAVTAGEMEVELHLMALLIRTSHSSFGDGRTT